jgi:NAD(P)H-hydrate epimerase
MLETVVADVNGLGVPIVAIDLPTGVSADSHEIDGSAIEATMTVTLAAPKIPLVFPPADSYGGDLVIADIGIPPPVLDELEGPYIELLTRERMRELCRPARRFSQRLRRVLIVTLVGKTGPHLPRWARCARAQGSSRLRRRGPRCRSSRRWARST